MTREQFTTLAGLLFDAHAGGGASPATAPRPSASSGSQAPRFDTSIARKGGMVQWASECSARELRYWIDRAATQESEPKYAESNAKQAKALGYFLAWREANPDALWSGERNRVRVTAAPPADKPTQYPRPPRDGGGYDAPPAQPTPDLGAGAADDSDIPFAPRWEP